MSVIEKLPSVNEDSLLLQLLPIACQCRKPIRQEAFEKFLSRRAEIVKGKIQSYRLKNPTDKSTDDDLYRRIPCYRNIYIDFWATLGLKEMFGKDAVVEDVDMHDLYTTYKKSCDESQDALSLLKMVVKIVKEMRNCCKATWMSDALSINGVHFRPTFGLTEQSFFEQICRELKL